ncbi:MAG TPA: hypothetical protein VN706_24185 [Gemmatimonadaceae bacterium]|nr:hypothetical protein [Gemmatimonadaceae bacterium]
MKRFSRAVFLVVAAALAACSDSSVSPKNPSQANAVVDGGGYTADLTAGDTSRFSITVDPSKNMAFYLGAGNQIRFPAGSICDPSSTYGPDQWDAPCTVATAPITFNVKAWLDSQGNPRTDFDKHVRFVPSTDSNHWVVIAFTAPAVSYSPDAKILYCVTASSGCVDESVTDPTMTTFRDGASGRLERRIKHFSGYNVFSGQPCMPSPDDPDCVDLGGEMLFDRDGGNHGGVSALHSVSPLVRDHTLPDHPSKSADIGPLGGELRLPQAGLTLVVPPGAVSKVTHFSVTSTGGKLVAYNFEPHGTKFSVPLVLRQDLRGTIRKSGGNIIGAYFADDSQLDPFGGVSFVNETLNATIDSILGEAELQIWHFSGYMLAWG